MLSVYLKGRALTQHGATWIGSTSSPLMSRSAPCMAAAAITESMSVCVSRWVDERRECIKAFGVVGGLKTKSLSQAIYYFMCGFLGLKNRLWTIAFIFLLRNMFC